MSAVSVMNPFDSGSQKVQAVMQYPAKNILELNFDAAPAENAGSVTENAATQSVSSISLGDILEIIWLSGAIAVGLWAIVSNLRFALYLRKNKTPLKIEFSLPVYTISGLPSPCLYGKTVSAQHKEREK
jgi:hypothetical protein